MHNSQFNGTKHSSAPKATASENRKVKVLYITGWGRSGSTILGRVLGQIKDFFLVGELRYIWDRGLIENRLCSCGLPFKKCPMWQEVTAHAFGSNDSIDAERIVGLRDRGLRTRHIALAPTRKGLQAKVARMGEYLDVLGKLYRAVGDVSHSRVIVDTSKFPAYGYTLQNTPDIELYVLHLVRDPRAVAYSWETKKKLRLDHKGGPNTVMTPHGFVESSLVWDEWNLAIERVWRHDPERYMLLRYEDFVENPQASVQSILRFLGEGGVELPFEDERRISLHAPHTFSGNPDRFHSGTITINSDEGWKQDMGIVRQSIVTALTWPGLMRYDYPLLPQREAIESS